MINLKGYNFLFGNKAVSPVIGTILMVAVTVIMAAIVGGFVYQTARPKVPPTISTSLADDPLLGVATDANGGALTPAVAPHTGASPEASTRGNRVAKLFFEGGQNIAIAELGALITYWDNTTTTPVERTVTLDGVYWNDALNGAGKPTNAQGSLMAATATTPSKLWLVWMDNDSSLDITPGDRIDFYEVDGVASASGVKKGSDFTVRVLHKATQAFVADHTIKVY